MIIGGGDIASVLPERDDLLFFASGVSNSGYIPETEYRREEDLLCEQSPDAHIVYFSSLGVLNGTSRYMRHKHAMEDVVRARFNRYTIIRIGNIAWGDNPHTLINHLKAHPDAEIRDEYRYIVEEDEFLHWISQIPRWSSEINIPGKRMKVKEVVDEYVRPYITEV